MCETDKLLERLELSYPKIFLTRPDVDEVILFVVLRHIGIRNERTCLEELFSGKTKKRTVLVRARLTKRHGIEHFFERFKKSFCLNKNFIPSRMSESFKKKPKKLIIT